MRLPSLAFALDSALKLDVQEPGPEPASPDGVIGGKLHEAEGQAHATHDSRRTALIGLSPVDAET